MLSNEKWLLTRNVNPWSIQIMYNGYSNSYWKKSADFRLCSESNFVNKAFFHIFISNILSKWRISMSCVYLFYTVVCLRWLSSVLSSSKPLGSSSSFEILWPLLNRAIIRDVMYFFRITPWDQDIWLLPKVYVVKSGSWSSFMSSNTGLRTETRYQHTCRYRYFRDS